MASFGLKGSDMKLRWKTGISSICNGVVDISRHAIFTNDVESAAIMSLCMHERRHSARGSIKSFQSAITIFYGAVVLTNYRNKGMKGAVQ